MKPEEIVREAHRQFDFRWAKSFKEMGCQTTCTKGCHACCAEPLLVNRQEAKLMFKAIPPAKWGGVRDRASVWIERAEASGILNLQTPRADHYLRAGLMCPLLENGLCLVYEQRPLGCRSHYAIGDPALCHDPAKRLTQKYVTSHELNQQTGLILCAASPDADHLGAYLARWLLRRKVTSAAEIKFPIESDGVDEHGVLHLRRI